MRSREDGRKPNKRQHRCTHLVGEPSDCKEPRNRKTQEVRNTQRYWEIQKSHLAMKNIVFFSLNSSDFFLLTLLHPKYLLIGSPPKFSDIHRRAVFSIADVEMA